ncbi:hypothetical protein KC332_g12182 [Hortaea werneckii]|nr:hypothetical protein KC358_g12216 [Hortaea werneckii]KAI6813346.1 hypothetical protein KC350_g11592 [Hortaea werneckii]KAI6914156.1 hypothetical protein KC348_g12290 [Hortaea werneckii]KAI6928655.1 hypothetical protein KC341_g11371 [Hortaea werneckii]KAI6961943.1 hypothetical protein KC321_g12037 [Hortaea werneckii]
MRAPAAPTFHRTPIRLFPGRPLPGRPGTYDQAMYPGDYRRASARQLLWTLHNEVIIAERQNAAFLARNSHAEPATSAKTSTQKETVVQETVQPSPPQISVSDMLRHVEEMHRETNALIQERNLEQSAFDFWVKYRSSSQMQCFVRGVCQAIKEVVEACSLRDEAGIPKPDFSAATLHDLERLGLRGDAFERIFAVFTEGSRVIGNDNSMQDALAFFSDVRTFFAQWASDTVAQVVPSSRPVQEGQQSQSQQLVPYAPQRGPKTRRDRFQELRTAMQMVWSSAEELVRGFSLAPGVADPNVWRAALSSGTARTLKERVRRTLGEVAKGVSARQVGTPDFESVTVNDLENILVSFQRVEELATLFQLAAKYTGVQSCKEVNSFIDRYVVFFNKWRPHQPPQSMQQPPASPQPAGVAPHILANPSATAPAPPQPQISQGGTVSSGQPLRPASSVPEQHSQPSLGQAHAQAQLQSPSVAQGPSAAVPSYASQKRSHESVSAPESAQQPPKDNTVPSQSSNAAVPGAASTPSSTLPPPQEIQEPLQSNPPMSQPSEKAAGSGKRARLSAKAQQPSKNPSQGLLVRLQLPTPATPGPQGSSGQKAHESPQISFLPASAPKWTPPVSSSKLSASASSQVSPTASTSSGVAQHPPSPMPLSPAMSVQSAEPARNPLFDRNSDRERRAQIKAWVFNWQNMTDLSENLKLKLLQTFDNPKYRDAKLHLNDPSMKVWLSKIAQQSQRILEWAAPGGTPDRSRMTRVHAVEAGLVGMRFEKLVEQLDGGYFIINHPELGAAQIGLKKLRILSDPSYM